jgi:tetratricopeptide (TPR) repeat protein
LAINKRKILEAAQKFLQKGSLDKALKEYQTLLQADPRDSNSRLKLGDIHLKLGQKDEAIAAYLKVAEQFMKDGFDAKAVALYKQITKIDANRSDVQVPLAELYQRLGLTSEAMAALQTAADAYHREGRKRDALELLRKMATLDPTNTTSRMKIAELLRQAGLKDEAIVEYEEVAAELARHDETEGLIQVYERILELDSNRPTALVGLARGLIAKGQADRAEPFAKRATEVRPDSTDGFELLAEAYRASGRVEELEPLYRKLADLHRMHGDEDRAREILQRFVSAEPLQLEESALQATPTPQEGEPDVLDDTPLPREGSAQQEEDDAAFFETAAPVPQATSPEVDVEQALAEASVYVRYGKHDRAIAGLEAVLSREPENRAALEKLGEVLSLSGDLARAVSVWTQAAKVARGEGDNDAVSLLRDRIEALAPGKGAGIDFGAAQSRPSPAPAPKGGPQAPGQPEPSDPFVDVDVNLDGPEGEPGAEAGSSPPADLEIDLGSDLLGDDLPPSLDQPEEESSEISDTAATPADLGDGGATKVAFDEASTGEEAEAGGSGGSSTTPQQIVEDLEEGEFYFHQGLHDEATAVYKKVLAAAPNHPQALLRLGEIAAARGQDPGTSSASAAAEKVAVTPPMPKRGKLEETDPSLGADNAPWSRKTEQGKAGSKAPAEEAALQQTDAREVSADFSDLMGDEDLEPPSLGSKHTGESLDLSAPSLGGESSTEVEGKRGADEGAVEDTDPDLATAVEEETEPEVPSESGTVSAEESSFDLAAELSEVFADDDRRSSGTSGSFDDSFAAVFREFKRGVQRTVSQGDYETHYDLGIAYREMGLFEDAVGEFQLAVESPTRRMDCLHMLGLCAIDLKRPEEAIAHLDRALALPDVPDPQQVALRFDLGRAFAQMGDRDRARTAFETVAALDPEFQDVGERLAELNGPDSSMAAEENDVTSDVIESLGGEDATNSNDESAAAFGTAENFESFDDVIAEAESELEPGVGRQGDTEHPGQRRNAAEKKDQAAPAPLPSKASGRATPAETPAPPERRDSEPGTNQSTGPTPPRRRKISFV